MFRLDRNVIKSKAPWLTEAVRWYRRRKNELGSLGRHIQRKKVQPKARKINEGIIKVVFICQYIPSWSKNKQLYETLKADKRFKTLLLCVPDRIRGNQLTDPDDLSNDTYDYFCQHGYEDAVNALVGYNTWYDLKGYHPDYVIYHRYDRPMPLCYTSGEVACYAKVCLIRYGHALIRAGDAMFDNRFAANAFCFFAETRGIRKEFYRCNTILCKLGLSNAVYCGTPAIENVYKAKNDRSEAWNFSHNHFRIIYAPRWTTDAIWGGSSFPQYGWTFFRLADEYPDIDVLLRPHPLMFDHFINTGVLDKDEVARFKEECNRRTNIKMDTEEEYHSTFWASDLLICDYTSIIIEYFVTKKPIIYLTYDGKMDYTDQMRSILDCSYIVNNQEELEKVITDLKNGNDPKKALREELCERDYLSNNNINASSNMRDFFVEKYYK